MFLQYKLCLNKKLFKIKMVLFGGTPHPSFDIIPHIGIIFWWRPRKIFGKSNFLVFSCWCVYFGVEEDFRVFLFGCSWKLFRGFFYGFCFEVFKVFFFQCLRVFCNFWSIICKVSLSIKVYICHIHSQIRNRMVDCNSWGAGKVSTYRINREGVLE